MSEHLLTALVDWSRAQFALTAMYHWIFVPLTLGLSFIIAFMHTLYVRSGEEKWKETTKFWMKLFAVNFAIGVATGIILEFEFGTNWSNYSWFVGDIFGAPLAIEGIFAFFMESTFVAVMLFGWGRVNKKFHLWSTWLTAIGTNLSAIWILVANAWMQDPAGTVFNPETARNEMVSFASVVLSETAVNKFLHTITQAYLLGSFFVIGVASWYILKNRHILFAKRSILVASVFGLFASIMVAVTGDGSAYNVAKKQPMKLAAMEGLYNGGENVGLIAIGIAKKGDDAVGIKLPGILSFFATRDFNGYVPGINDLLYGDPDHDIPSTQDRMFSGKIAVDAFKNYKIAFDAGDTVAAAEYKQLLEDNYHNFGYAYFEDVEETVPPVALTFYSFHLMVMLGGYFIFIFAVILFLSLKDKFANKKLLLKLSVLNIFLAYLASQLGWIVAEVGRQPWTIQDILPVQAATSGLQASSVQITFFMFAAIFTALLIAELGIMFKMIKKGPNLNNEEA
ncbi:MAG: cytochrome ubiquinol oxidase subunit I [Bacteroidales bacterium]|nr:cytochrome ubiquinol oxidase subunit I [Bacteroidales bacterium]